MSDFLVVIDKRCSHRGRPRRQKLLHQAIEGIEDLRARPGKRVAGSACALGRAITHHIQCVRDAAPLSVRNLN